MDHRKSLASALHAQLTQAGAELSLTEIESLLEIPRDSSHGDLAFPCFPLAKILRKPPQKIAAELAEQLGSPDGISKVNVVGAYLNFFVDRSSLARKVIPAILDGSFFAPRGAKPGKIMVEYSQPNTHKALHVGHSRCAILGDVLVRILEWAGHETIAANYLGDEGTHVACCLWYFRNHFEGEIPETHRGEFLGRLYSQAVKLVSLSAMTKAPLPGVVAAKVASASPHPNDETLQIVGLETIEGQRMVVCGGTGFVVGDMVAYAAPGTRVDDRPITEREVKAVVSSGMICSGAELGINSDKETITVLPSDTEPGTEVAEIFATQDGPVLPVWRQRKAEVGQVLAQIESGAGELHDLWMETRQWSINEFMEHYRWLDCRFDHWFYESEFGESSKELAREFQKRGLFVESDGTIGADLTESVPNLGFLILVKSNGTATYASRDLVLARKKFEDFGVTQSLYVVDRAQRLHFQQVFKCLEKMGYAQAQGCHHHDYGRVVLADTGAPCGYREISSRAGDAILFSELRSGLEGTMRDKFLNAFEREWSEEELKRACRVLSMAAIRYGMLRQSNDSMVVFDLKRWIDPKGETGIYLLYAYARIQSIKRKTGLQSSSTADWSLLSHEAEISLLSSLVVYPDTITRATDEYAPNHLCGFAYQLCRAFNRFYRDCSIKDAENDSVRLARLSLADVVGLTLKHCLSLLGIEVLEQM